MTRIDKLYANVLANPGQLLAFKDFITLIEAFGFRHARTKGSHRSYSHPACPRLLVIQPKGKDAKRYQVGEFLDMIEEYSLQREA